MRPVRLDLNGFAGFRDATTVDFTGADYFALVGPTGSGKSTVIDAMTFALYGSAPRWGSVSSIQYALAPTANRCAVRLIFDVAGQRYVVAREVRRSGQQILQKSSVLERYADPAASGDPAADEPTEPLAGDPKAVRQQVIELLGLEFDDFCTCVVLPQGDFATFLQASASERQTILLKLLGARVYDAIGKVAGRQAAEAGTRVDLLTGQLRDLADATEEAEAAARGREEELAGLRQQTEQAAAELREVKMARDATRARAEAASAEIARLRSVATPPDVATLQDALDAAATAYRSAADVERQLTAAAQDADQAMRDGPGRAGLAETLRWQHERTGHASRLDGLRTTERRAVDGLAAATAAAETAHASIELARAARHAAEAARSVAAARVAEVERRLAAVTAVELPIGLGELADAQAGAVETSAAAQGALTAAEGDLAQARDTRAALPDRSAVAALRRVVEEYAAAVTVAAGARAAERDGLDAVESARVGRTARAAERDAAVAAWEDARARSTAAHLRPHLRTGDACPVCDQPVAVLPPPLASPELATTRSARDAAESALAKADTEFHRAGTAMAAAATRAAAAAERVRDLDAELAATLPDRPAGPERDSDGDLTESDHLIAKLTAATDREEAAGRAVAGARAAVEAADQASARLNDQTRDGWASLNALAGRLTPLGAPAVTATALATGWQDIEVWARTVATDIECVERPRAQGALVEIERELDDASQRLGQADLDDRATAAALTAATVAERAARSERERLLARLDELAALLVDRPAAAEAELLLAECNRLETAAAQARDAAGGAARKRVEAEDERDRLADSRDQARAALHLARDPLVGLGAPPVDDQDLARSWSVMSSWARDLAIRRSDDLTRLEADLASSEETLADGVAGLARAVAEHGIDLAEHRVRLDPTDPGLPSRLEALTRVVTVERERARGRTAEVARRRRAANELRTRIAADTETQQVAAELQRLMGSRRFPQWLADAALDTLVADASDSLLRLSNEQFELTHQRGEFFVIDHADADSRRSVRTLSGGETFQASLALALALSEQLSTLAAGGRTTLDSIFLDEGFGTLDPDALEIVAGTLETLAQEDRMVGVITHVTALAERVPVRFEVSRDSRTATIERVGP